MVKVAVVQVRGCIGMNKKLRDSLRILKLPKKNSCVVIDGNRSYQGMLIKLKDYVTWGEVDDGVFKLLLEKRGRLPGRGKLTEEYLKEKVKMGFDEFVDGFMKGEVKIKDVPGLKPFFRLKPPVGGYERKGIKVPFSMGGALGYRKDKINDLLRRMI